MGKEEQLKDKLEGYSCLNIFLSPFLFSISGNSYGTVDGGTTRGYINYSH